MNTCAKMMACVGICLLAVVMTAGAPASGATYTWDGTANNWNTAHWWNGSAYVAGPTGASNANSAIINSGTVTFAQHDSFGNHTTTASPIITINGGTLASGGRFTTIWNLNMGGGTLLANGGANATYPAFQLAGTLAVSGSAASAINVGGGSNNMINVGGNGNTTLTIDVADVTGDTNADLTINTVLKNSPFGGGSLTKTGLGTLTLTGLNTYTGGTIVNQGVLAVGGATNTVNGNVLVNANGTLRLAAPNVLGTGTAVTLNGGTFDLQGHRDYFASLTMGGNAQVTGSGWFILNDPSGNVTTTGTGNAGTIAARMAIASQYGSASGARTQTFDIIGGTSLTVSGAIANNLEGSAQTGSLRKIGDGTLILTNQGNSYTGATSIQAGTVILQGGNGRVLGGSGITVEPDGTIQWNASHNIADTTPLTVNGGTLNLQNRAEYLGVLTLNEGSQVNGTPGSFLVFTGAQGLVQAAGNAGTIAPDIAITSPPGWGPSGGTNRTQAFDVAAGGMLTVAGRILNVVPDGSAPYVGSVVKNGMGTLVLDGLNAYTGLTTVAAGTLLVHGEVAGAVNVDPAATLGGRGTVGTVTAAEGAHVSPGASTGELTTGDLFLSPKSILDIELGLAEGDVLNVLGDVIIGGAVLHLIPQGSFSHVQGSQYLILQNDLDDAVDGVFEDLDEGARFEAGGNQFAITYLGGTGNDVVLTAVPEPASLGLLLAGVAGLGGYLRRRRTR